MRRKREDRKSERKEAEEHYVHYEDQLRFYIYVNSKTEDMCNVDIYLLH